MTFLLRGEEISIRNSRPEDQKTVEELVRDTNCSLMALGGHPERIHVYHPREELFPATIEENKHYRLIIENQEGVVMGYIAFRLASHAYRRAELSYFVADKFKGHGYATKALNLMVAYAFKELKIRRLFLEIAEKNLPSLRVAEKAGFVKEGLMKDYKNFGQKWQNYWLMAQISE